MGRANITSGDKLVKYPMANSMEINLDMLGMFMKIRIVGKKDFSLVITIHGHVLVNQAPDEKKVPKASQRKLAS